MLHGDLRSHEPESTVEGEGHAAPEDMCRLISLPQVEQTCSLLQEKTGPYPFLQLQILNRENIKVPFALTRLP